MNFSDALNRIKSGDIVCRSSWNGKGMFIFLNPASDVTVTEGRPLAYTFNTGTELHINPYIMMKTSDKDLTIVPWVASQTDILAEDWEVVK